MKREQPAQVVEVERLAQSGEGVAQTDGGALFIPGALPGEQVVVRPVGRGRARMLDVARASPARVVPLCSVFDACGGCAWQHASVALQREARLTTLRRALPPALRDAPVEYIAAPEPYHYRSRARLAWHVGPEHEIALGFRARSTHDVVDAPGCPVLVPALDAALPVLRSVLRALPPSGELHLALGTGGRPVAALHPERIPDVAGFRVADQLVANGFAGASVWAPGAVSATVAGDPRPIVQGADGQPLHLAPEGFAQANERLNELLAQRVVALAMPAGSTVLELYAGAGNFTVLLARDAQRVIAVESERGAVDALRRNLAARMLENVTAVEGDAVDAAGRRADVVVLDPPRTGAREVCETLARKPPRRVVYVSCDAATFGRDLGTLSSTMRLDGIWAFEMFPQTPHLEMVALLQRSRSTPR